MIGRQSGAGAPGAGAPAAPVIGLAVGRGTGPELAAVFEQVLGALTADHPTGVRIARADRLYHSYVSLRAERDPARVQRLTAQAADHYEDFCRTLAAGGATALFRTAINAQSLYLVRQRLRAVKVDLLRAGGTSLLLVRDQAQGFYTGENQHAPGRLTRTLTFSRDITEAVIEYAVRRARREWPDGRIDRLVMAYKFHLLDGAFDRWVADIADRLGLRIEVFQPDTVNRNLITHGLPERILLIAGNEWADIMHVVLLDRFGSERQENRCTENVLLGLGDTDLGDTSLGDAGLRDAGLRDVSPGGAGLVEYQTVHGSADDLAGRDLVNPVATIRAAAVIAERHVGVPGAVGAVEAALAELEDLGVRTADLGGEHSTGAVADALVALLTTARATAPAHAAAEHRS
ncbi:isocitrate/isopropylmalate family dehydrogenase [Streptomyces sp. NPDC056549]|uniref:isocitrate/isopropylmalate family dehydrogenase n=1 Tax=Streptomyces sp. NPDC056549 TaxID=3345864 RepID=UPI0036A216F1